MRRFTDIPFLPIHFDFVDTAGQPLLGRRAAGERARQLHRARARPAGRLPGRRRDRGRAGRADAALSRPIVLYPESGRAVACVGRRRCRSASRRLRHRGRPAPRPARWQLAEPREDVAEVATSTPTACPAGSTVRPDAARRASSSTCTAAASSSTTSTSTTRPPAGSPTAPACAVLSVDYRRPPEHRFPAAPDDVDDRRRAGWTRQADEPRARRADVRPRRQRRRQPRAGGRAAQPGPVPRGRADLPVPRPDGRLRLLPDARPTASTPREAAWYWQQYAAPRPT